MSVASVGDRVWTFTADDRTALFAEADGSVVAVDTLAGASASAFAAAIAETVPGTPVGHVVYALDHLDHTGGGGALSADAEVVAHELCARVVAGRGASSQLPVTRTVGGAGDTVTLSGRELGLAYPGPSQGTGNLAVSIGGVLFVAGPRADARYGLFPDFHFTCVTSVWRELADGASTVIPARGAPMDAAGLRRAADYIDALCDASQHAFADGVPIWIYEAMEPYVRGRLEAEWGGLDGFGDHVGIGAIRTVHHYLMGGWGLEDTREPERLLTAA
jgi:glyoxylase-like metal-dependent hydrolase (beta-lactamase superfamily II)